MNARETSTHLKPHQPAAKGWDELRSRTFLREIDVKLPKSGTVFSIWKPDDMDRLLDDVQDDPEQNLPYWAEVWPSGVALADEIIAEPGLLAGKSVFEIGSGIGITAIAALRANADLTVADYAPDALTLCRENTRRNANRQPGTIQCNWRAPETELAGLKPFPIVLAADVLYEARDVEPLLALLDSLVAPDGLLWLAEPGRAAAKRFLAVLVERGWIDQSQTHVGPWLDPEDAGTIVTVHRLRRATAPSQVASESSPSS